MRYRVTEDQELSGEAGITSNWWIIGAQGSTLTFNSEATLHAMPHSILSPPSSQNQIEHSDSEIDKRLELQEKKQKSTFNDEEEDSERRKGIQNCNNGKEGEQEQSEDGESHSESEGLY